MLNSIGGLVSPFFIVVVNTVAVRTQDYALFNLFMRLSILTLFYPFIDALYLGFWVNMMKIESCRVVLPTAHTA